MINIIWSMRMEIFQALRKVIFCGEEINEVNRKQFVKGFKDGYSDPHHIETGDQWYELGLLQGRVARSSGMTSGKISFPDL
jgi:hypothetical protein